MSTKAKRKSTPRNSGKSRVIDRDARAVVVVDPETDQLKRWASSNKMQGMFAYGWQNNESACRAKGIAVDDTARRLHSVVVLFSNHLFTSEFSEEALVCYLDAYHDISPSEFDEMTIDELLKIMRADAAKPPVQNCEDVPAGQSAPPQAVGYQTADTTDVTKQAVDEHELSDELKALAGKERRVLQLLIEADGRTAVANIATDPLIGWQQDYDGNWNSTRQRLNRKIKKKGWQITTQSHEAVLSALPSARN